MVRMIGELNAIKSQIAVVKTELGVAMPGEVKLATKQKRLAAEECNGDVSYDEGSL